MSDVIKNINEWEVETPSGWSNFTAVKKINKKQSCNILFTDDNFIEGSLNHKIKMNDGEFTYLSNVDVGDVLYTGEIIKNKKINNHDIALYDLLDVEKNNEYYTNNIISHNCAFIPKIDTIWTAAQSTLSTGGQCIALSCVTSDTYVFTDKGIKQINYFIPENKIYGDYEIDSYNIAGNNTLRRGNLFHVNGKVKTKKLKTKLSELEGSYNHKVWACQDGKYDWYRLDNLNIGDWVNVQYNMNVWGDNNDVFDFNPTITSNHKNIFNPSKISEDIAYFMGLYISEGSSYKVINENGELNGGTITITCGDDVTDPIKNIGLKYSTSDNMHYSVSSKTLIEFMEHVGFDLSFHAHNKVIPSRLMEMGKDNISALLSGIFDGDGFSTTRHGTIGIGLSSKKLIEQIRILLLNFGIRSKYYRVSKELMNSHDYFDYGFNYDSHRLELNIRDSKIFYDKIGFRFNRKQANKLVTENKNIGKSNDVIPYSYDLMNEFFDIYDKGNWSLTKYHDLNISNIVNKQKTYKSDHISSENVYKFYNIVKSKLPENRITEIEKFLIPDSEWVQITELGNSENETFDFSLPNSDDFWGHSVIYNGILGHQTPNGVGNWFHKTYTAAEEGESDWNFIKLHWSLHPDRDQEYRDEQDKLLGPSMAAQECDCSFLTSGQTVIDGVILEDYKNKQVEDPMEKRGFDSNLWIWRPPNYSKDYVLSADVARGDGTDFSAFHVIDVQNLEQVAEYKGKISTKDFGNLCMNTAVEYNNALLVIENASIGWAAIQQVIDRDYDNLFYTSKDLHYVDVQRQISNKYRNAEQKMVPGFSMTMKTRPLVIAKLEEYFREKTVIVHSSRLIEELFVFIYHNNKAQAMVGYNDDLPISLAIGMWVRDTALRLKSEGIALQKDVLNRTLDYEAVYQPEENQNDYWEMETGREKESLDWLIK